MSCDAIWGAWPCNLAWWHTPLLNGGATWLWDAVFLAVGAVRVRVLRVRKRRCVCVRVRVRVRKRRRHAAQHMLGLMLKP